MKRLFINLLSIFLIQLMHVQDANYWYKDTQISLSTVSQKRFILVMNATDTADVKNQIARNGNSIEKFRKANISIIPCDCSSTTSYGFWTMFDANNNIVPLSEENMDYSVPCFLT